MAEYPYDQTLKGKMLGSTQAFGLPVPSATKDFPLGCLLYDETTGTIYKYLQATAATIALGDVVSYSGAGGVTVLQQAATAAGVAARGGVSPYAFTASYYGFIAVHGPILTKSGTVSAGNPVTPAVGTAGTVAAVTISNPPLQAEVVASGATIGVALGSDSAGFATIFLNRCL